MIGALSAMIAVGAGAFGAHGLRNSLEPRYLEIFETGVRYQMYHSLGLVAVAWAIGHWQSSTLLSSAGWCFVIGIILFSGSLYALALTGISKLGAITPFGGLAFIIGWGCMAWGCWIAGKLE